MEKQTFWKVFSTLLAFVLVLSLLFPFPASTQAKDTSPFKPAQNESQFQIRSAIAEQTKLLQGGPKLHKDLEGLPADKTVRVIVHLSERPVALEQGVQAAQGKGSSAAQVGEAKAAVVAQQAAVKGAIQAQKLSVTQGFSYNTVLNGFSATVKAGELKKLLAIQGVTLIEPDVHIDSIPEVPKQLAATAAFKSSSSFLGVDKLWAEGLDGKGIKIAVLDTGIDPDHPEFKGIYKGGRNFVPHSSKYAKPRAKDDASETKPSERPKTTPEKNEVGMPFATTHGTHVSGIIAATGANDFGFKGIAPKVDLYAYRVLGAYTGGEFSSILAGIEEAVIQDMDIINLSLGAFNASEADAMAFALNNAMLGGTIAVSAAGNNGLFRGSIGTPATSRLGIAVGNSTLPETHYSGTVNATVGKHKLAKIHNMMATTFEQDPAVQLKGTFELAAVPGAGAAADYKGLNVKGKVVVVARGEIPFPDKIKAAKEQGAKAVLIHNIRNAFEGEGPMGIYFGDSFDFIPAFDLSRADGEALRLALAKEKGTVTFSNIKTTTTAGDAIAESSSSGPSTPNFDIKPDVVAPGMNILSAKPMYKTDFPNADYKEAYFRESGTSMSAPHIAGIAALIKQAHPNWTPFDIKVALANSAKVLDPAKYDVFAQGAGRVQAYGAAHPAALAYSQDKAVQNQSGTQVDNTKGSVTFGPQPIKQKNISATKKILVKDITGKGGNYKVAIDVKKKAGNAKLTVDKPTFTLSKQQELKLTLTASKNANAAYGDEIIGWIRISNGTTTMSLPFAADLSGEFLTELQTPEMTGLDLSFDGDGFNDKAEYTFNLTGALAKNSLEIWDIMNPRSGGFEDGYIGYIHSAGSLKAGKVKIPITGKYRPWTGAPETTIPDGMYSFDFLGIPASASPPFVGTNVFPVFIKSTDPVITAARNGNKISGKVEDKYLTYNTELTKYGLQFDLNAKLNASYVVTRSDGEQEAVPFGLEQDGTFNVELENFNAETDSLTIIVTDAAGNKGEAKVSQSN